jgi:Family of unknown function (DUF5719)
VNRLLTDARSRLGVCAAVLLVLGLLALVWQPSAAGPDQAGPKANVVVNRAALACPALGAGGEVRTVVDVASPQLPEGTPTAKGDTKPVELTTLTAATPTELGAVTARGRMVSSTPLTKPLPLVVRATGPLSAGAVATVTSTAGEGVNRGIASTPCVAPSAEFWFVGASAGPGRRDALVLSNLDEVPASVDVIGYGREGQLESAGTRGIVVPGKTQTELFLNTFARGQREIALKVTSTGGRVAAALRDNVSNGALPAGVDWLPPVATPAQSVLVPAVARGKGPRVLSVVNPGEIQTSVSVTVHGANGPFKPAKSDVLDVPAGGVRSIRLEEALRGEPAAVALESEEPVSASMRLYDAKASEFAVSAAASALTGPAYLPLAAHPEPLDVVLTAPKAKAAVAFEVRTGAGQVVQRRQVDVPAGATVAISVPATQRSTYLSVTPEDPDTVVAGVTLTPPAKGGGTVRLAGWPLTTAQVFRAQLGAGYDVRSALR